MQKEIKKNSIKITDLAKTKAIQVADAVEVSTLEVSVQLKQIARDKLKKERFEIIEKVGDSISGYCGKCRKNMLMIAVYRVKLVNARITLVGYCETCETQIYKKEGRNK